MTSDPEFLSFHLTRVTREYDAVTKGADSTTRAVGPDGKEFQVKRAGPGGLRDMPIIEFTCYWVAVQTGTRVPCFEILEMQDSTWAFGSVILVGYTTLEEQFTAFNLHFNPQWKSVLARVFTEIYTLDCFLGNPDRHFGNYMFKWSHELGQQLELVAIDFSRALTGSGQFPPLQFPPLGNPPNTNTRTYTEKWRPVYGFDVKAAEQVVTRLRDISTDSLGAILNKTPNDWRVGGTYNFLLDWWPESRDVHIQNLERHISMLSSDGRGY
ncbi:MAG: hypothetical protein HKL81_02425 [Acidimicrobiaceae bacterium]|nr:hypothetical protein [Acidimicrobiaceae bacterium]